MMKLIIIRKTKKNNVIKEHKDKSYFTAIMDYFKEDKTRIKENIKINAKYNIDKEN